MLFKRCVHSIYLYNTIYAVLRRWNYAVSGLNPWSYHAVNVLLHATVSALFAWLCRNCLGLSKLSALLTASLFAIHPIHTEAVSVSVLIFVCTSVCLCVFTVHI